jgi:hypothetical protein
MFGDVISKGVEKRQSYPTDLTSQWSRIEPLIPAVKPGGRRREDRRQTRHSARRRHPDGLIFAKEEPIC